MRRSSIGAGAKKNKRGGERGTAATARSGRPSDERKYEWLKQSQTLFRPDPLAL